MPAPRRHPLDRNVSPDFAQPAGLAGRKPGTRVVSLRDGTCGIHTLLLERTAKA